MSAIIKAFKAMLNVSDDKSHSSFKSRLVKNLPLFISLLISMSIYVALFLFALFSEKVLNFVLKYIVVIIAVNVIVFLLSYFKLRKINMERNMDTHRGRK